MKSMLSVIIPVYNTKDFLQQCVDSVLNQTLKEIEIILVDDESPDNAGALCDKLSEQFNNILVIHKKNHGLGLARNSGLEVANGKYVAFLDSDDYVESDYYMSLVNLCESENADICYATGYIKFGPKNNNKYYFGIKEKYLEGSKLIKKELTRLISSKPGGEDNIPASSCFSVFRLSFLNNYKLRFESERELMSEDLWFTMDCFNCATKVVFSNTIGYNYRYNENSLSRSYNPDRFIKLIYFVNQINKKCEEFCLEDYSERVAMYFWVNFEKCINQEIRYKNITNRKAYLKIKEMCENNTSQKMLFILNNNPEFNSLHGFLCKLLYYGHYQFVLVLLKIYNAFVH